MTDNQEFSIYPLEFKVQTAFGGIVLNAKTIHLHEKYLRFQTKDKNVIVYFDDMLGANLVEQSLVIITFAKESVSEGCCCRKEV